MLAHLAPLLLGLPPRVFSPYLPLLTHGLRAFLPCLPLLCLTFVAHRWTLALGLRVFSLHLSLLIQAPRIALLHLPLLGHELTAFLSHSRPLYLTVSSGRSRLLCLLFSLTLLTHTLLPRPGVSRPRSLRRAPCGRLPFRRSASPVCCGGAQEASLAACDGLRTASGSSSAVRAVGTNGRISRLAGR